MTWTYLCGGGGGGKKCNRLQKPRDKVTQQIELDMNMGNYIDINIDVGI